MIFASLLWNALSFLQLILFQCTQYLLWLTAAGKHLSAAEQGLRVLTNCPIPVLSGSSSLSASRDWMKYQVQTGIQSNLTIEEISLTSFPFSALNSSSGDSCPHHMYTHAYMLNKLVCCCISYISVNARMLCYYAIPVWYKWLKITSRVIVPRLIHILTMILN